MAIRNSKGKSAISNLANPGLLKSPAVVRMPVTLLASIYDSGLVMVFSSPNVRCAAPWFWSFGVPPAPPVVRPEVYELIRRGDSHRLKASMFDVPQAVASFRAAIELDPAYAPSPRGSRTSLLRTGRTPTRASRPGVQRGQK